MLGILVADIQVIWYVYQCHFSFFFIPVSRVSLLLKDLSFNFYLLLLQLVLCRDGGPKKSPRTSSIVQVIFSFLVL